MSAIIDYVTGVRGVRVGDNKITQSLVWNKLEREGSPPGGSDPTLLGYSCAPSRTSVSKLIDTVSPSIRVS